MVGQADLLLLVVEEEVDVVEEKDVDLPVGTPALGEESRADFVLLDEIARLGDGDRVGGGEFKLELGEGGRDASCAGTVELILLADAVEVGG